jgi:hypothetical protein
MLWLIDCSSPPLHEHPHPVKLNQLLALLRIQQCSVVNAKSRQYHTCMRVSIYKKKYLKQSLIIAPWKEKHGFKERSAA